MPSKSSNKIRNSGEYNMLIIFVTVHKIIAVRHLMTGSLKKINRITKSKFVTAQPSFWSIEESRSVKGWRLFIAFRVTQFQLYSCMAEQLRFVYIGIQERFKEICSVKHIKTIKNVKTLKPQKREIMWF